MKIHTNFRFLLIPALLFFLSTCTDCSKNIKDSDTNSRNKTDEDKSSINKEYQKEGFISKDTFRIVIVTPGESEEDIKSIENTARRRAFMSLQKYLSSSGKTIDQNTRAKLLNLINQNGDLRYLQDDTKTRKVYIFDVKRNDLKGYLDRNSSRR